MKKEWWKSEKGREKYIKELEKLYRAIGRYLRTAEFLASMRGLPVYYAIDKSDIFLDFCEGIDNEWVQFISEFYGVMPVSVMDKQDIGYVETMEVATTNSVHLDVWCKKREQWVDGTIMIDNMRRVYEKLTRAGLEDNGEGYSINSREILRDTENLIKMMVKLSPITNQKTAFVLSLHYLPRGYAEMVYKSMKEIEKIFGWNAITSWSNISTEWQIGTFTDEKWKNIAEALQIIYSNDLRVRLDILRKYLHRAPYYEWLYLSLDNLRHAYGKDPVFSEYLRGATEDFYELCAEIKSLKEFEVNGFFMCDGIREIERISLQSENLIKFIAPQMYLNIGGICFMGYSRWMLNFYVPKFMINDGDRELPDNLEMNPVNVEIPSMPYNTILPENWQLHSLWRYLVEREEFLRVFADPDDNGDENRD